MHLPLLSAPIIILAGAVLLAFGRKLFWLFVGIVGFLGGMYLGAHFFNADPEWTLWVIAIGIGLVGAVLALFLQKMAIGVAGFLTGGFLSMNFGEMIGWHGDQVILTVFLAGGIIGAIMTWILFEWALIALTSAAGAYLIQRELPFHYRTRVILLVILSVIGVGIQARSLRKKKHPREKSTS